MLPLCDDNNNTLYASHSHLVEQPVEACKCCSCCEGALQGVGHPADQREAHTSTKRCSHAVLVVLMAANNRMDAELCRNIV